MGPRDVHPVPVDQAGGIALGGTRNGTIVHWPNGIEAAGEVRHQFCHVTDVAPTVLDAVGLPFPTLVNGVAQEPFHGTSMAYTFDDPDAAGRHETQYFELQCNRGIYHNGWSAVTRHAIPWQAVGRSLDLDADVWELYDASTDWTQAHDLSAEHPDKLASLQQMFLIEAAKYNVLPLDPRAAERFNPELAGRPAAVKGNSQRLYGGMHRLQENAVINLKNHSHTLTADVVIPDDGARGVIMAQGGDFGGWALYGHDGQLRYHYNFVGVLHTTISSDTALPTGAHQIGVTFTYHGGGLGKGADVTLQLDGNPIGGGRVERTHGIFFSMDETADVGRDAGAPVSPDYGPRNNDFTGTVNWVQIDITDTASDADHVLANHDRFHHAALAKQ